MKKSKKRSKAAKLIKYFRELSIVIIGVLITLTITNITSDKSKQKEVKQLMGLIKTELGDNLKNIEEVQQQWNKEQDVFLLVKQNIDDLEKIPIDTLIKYKHKVGALYFIQNQRDSYEVFKSSLLFQYVKNKDLLRKLAETYRTIDALNIQLTSYSNRKSAGFAELLQNMNEREIQQWTDGTVYEYFRLPLKSSVYRLLVYDGRTILDPNIFSKSQQMIVSMIEDIEEQDF